MSKRSDEFKNDLNIYTQGSYNILYSMYREHNIVELGLSLQDYAKNIYYSFIIHKHFVLEVLS